jgi:sulfoxide reductase heme-binding subunit YedZ
MRKWRWRKVLLFLLGLAPLFWLAWRAWDHRLTANPLEFITHYTGDWTLRLIIISLTVTPLRKVLNLPELIRYRRMIGLFAFFYGCLHFLTYIWFDKFFDVHEMIVDVAKRRYITVGFTGFVMLIPLAVTSTAGWIRRLGGKRWQLLHRLVYLTAVCGVVHYYWLVKSDIRLPVFYGILVALLLGWRIASRKRAPGRPASPPSLRTSPEPVAR